MRRVLFTSFTAVMAIGATVSLAHAGPITGVSLTTSGAFKYIGTGPVANPNATPNNVPALLGTGLYSLGTCGNNGSITTCLLTGTYTETSGTNVNDIGNFTLTTTYADLGPGVGPSPITARSAGGAGNQNILGFTSGTLNGALMMLALSPSYGGLYTATLPPFGSTGLIFSGFLDGASANCSTGAAPAACTIASVGLTPGAILTGTLLANGLTFTIPQNTPNTAPVPEPSTWLLLGTGVAALVARRRMRA